MKTTFADGLIKSLNKAKEEASSHEAENQQTDKHEFMSSVVTVVGEALTAFLEKLSGKKDIVIIENNNN